MTILQLCDHYNLAPYTGWRLARSIGLCIGTSRGQNDGYDLTLKELERWIVRYEKYLLNKVKRPGVKRVSVR